MEYKMNLFKKYYRLIVEEETAEDRYRKSKGLKPLEKLSPYEQLEKYKDDPDVYISFRTLEIIGINPSSVYKTPNGIYTYPLSLLWYGDDFDHEEKQIEVPFAGNYPYIYVIRPNSNARILDLEKYNESDYNRDIKKLVDSKFLKSKESADDILKEINILGQELYGARIWGITYYLSATNIDRDRKVIINNNQNLWNRLLHKTLEYDYILDRGKKIIHGHEPTQAVFLANNTYKVIKIINNKFNLNREEAKNVWDGGEYPEMIWKNGLWKDGTFTGDPYVQAFFRPKKNKNSSPSSTNKDKIKTWITGIWKKGIFKNALWKNGLWKDGTFQNSFWWKGTWEKGKMIYSNWSDGTWKDGEFINSSWTKGIWEKGIHDCNGGSEDSWQYGDWLDGTWKNGKWEAGNWHKGDWIRGVWNGGTWFSGDWYEGTFGGGEWKKGTWHKGDFRGGIWLYGTWLKGKWHMGYWNDGIWKDGIFYSGVWEKGDWRKGTWKGKYKYAGQDLESVWKGGTWHDGTWIYGTWLGGYDKYGNYHPKGDSPDKWKLDKKEHWADQAETSNANYKIIDDNKIIWYDGYWNGGTWKGGVFKNGAFTGTWLGGVWEGGTWISGYDKNGNYHPYGDSPDKWILK